MRVPSNSIMDNSLGFNSLIIRIVIFSIVGLYCAESTAPAVGEEIAVIVNVSNPVKSLTSREVSDIFLARRKVFPSSSKAVFVVEQPQNSQLREEFFRLLKMSLKQVNAYWARLQFSGDVQPPKALPDSKAVVEVIRQNPDAIGYVEAKSVDSSVQVILHLKD